MRRGLASLGRDVRDHADLTLELLEIHGIALNISTDEVVEGAFVRALRIFAVHQTHGCGDEVEVAAGSESAGRACRPARQEHAALTTACARVVRELGARCCVLSTADGERLYSASACVMWPKRACSPCLNSLLRRTD